MEDLVGEIQSLKEKHNALILAHFYEDPAIQDIADFVGDSLFLAQKGQECDNPVVLLAGVVGMAVGGRVTPKVRNHLMKARVIIQALILVLVVILVIATWLGEGT